jgi:hypothetical protein
MTHDYKRHGTTTLFAALELAQDKVVGECYQRHRHQEFLKFLRRLDGEFPGPLALHLVMDNYGTHSKEEVRAWLKKHPRFRLHFVPTSSSWLNLVERWFRELSAQCIRRGAFFSVSVDELQHAIPDFLDAWNEHPKPFVWTATVDSIMEAVALPADPGADSARLYPATQQKQETISCLKIVYLFCGHYSSSSASAGDKEEAVLLGRRIEIVWMSQPSARSCRTSRSRYV